MGVGGGGGGGGLKVGGWENSKTQSKGGGESWGAPAILHFSVHLFYNDDDQPPFNLML